MLTGTLPAMGKLVNLVQFYGDNNQITGTLPSVSPTGTHPCIQAEGAAFCAIRTCVAHVQVALAGKPLPHCYVWLVDWPVNRYMQVLIASRACS